MSLCDVCLSPGACCKMMALCMIYEDRPQVCRSFVAGSPLRFHFWSEE